MTGKHISQRITRRPGHVIESRNGGYNRCLVLDGNGHASPHRSSGDGFHSGKGNQKFRGTISIRGIFCSRNCFGIRQAFWVIAAVLLLFGFISISWQKQISPEQYVYNPLDRREGVHPRKVRYLMKENYLQILDPDYEISTFRELQIPRWQVVAQQRFETMDSRDFEYSRPDPFETKQCQAQYQWQKMSYPTCNLLHEVDMTRPLQSSEGGLSKTKHSPNQLEYLASGYWRDIWILREWTHRENSDGFAVSLFQNLILKTMRYQHEFSERNYDRHRRDATAMERLTKSMYVLDIYAYCGNSGLFEHGNGDIAQAIWSRYHNLTQQEKLSIATQAASGLAAVHNVDKEGQASIAHTDISPGQFIKVRKTYKLNDFNRARFLRWNHETDEPCGFRVDRNPGRNRSPEEYKHSLQSEKVDVYSLGNIFYMILQRDWPFSDVDEAEAQKLVKDGFRPSFDVEVWNSTDPVDTVLKEAMIMCHEQDPEARATARQVESFLKEKSQGLFDAS